MENKIHNVACQHGQQHARHFFLYIRFSISANTKSVERNQQLVAPVLKAKDFLVNNRVIPCLSSVIKKDLFENSTLKACLEVYLVPAKPFRHAVPINTGRLSGRLPQ